LPLVLSEQEPVVSMVCRYCRKKIGAVRKLKDPHFCSDDHRKKYTSRSARAVREAEDLYGVDDTQLPTWRTITQAKNEDKPGRSGLSTAVFAGLAAVFAVLALSQLPMGGPAVKSISPLPDTNPHSSRAGGFAQMIGSMLESKSSGTLREDFHAGVANWEGFRSAGSDWAVDGGQIRPTSLRVWKPSTSMSNYEMEFMGQIERKSIDWAFRASDVKNYYATKLIITKPGPLPNAGLVRFIVLDGRERERVELPLPLTLERGVDYRVRVSVRDGRFLTSVNGQLISSWMDNRLSRGGVGFFSEDGESALLKWVSVSERDSFLGRIVSHFSIISFPTAP
jgi:hypothetical protein